MNQAAESHILSSCMQCHVRHPMRSSSCNKEPRLSTPVNIRQHFFSSLSCFLLHTAPLHLDISHTFLNLPCALPALRKSRSLALGPLLLQFALCNQSLEIFLIPTLSTLEIRLPALRRTRQELAHRVLSAIRDMNGCIMWFSILRSSGLCVDVVMGGGAEGDARVVGRFGGDG
jgi:hypothetical protein